MIFKQNILLALLPTLALGLSACGSHKTDLADTTPAIKVKVMPVVSGDMVREYNYPAAIESERRITLSTKVMGKITFLPFEKGASVQAGQVLLKIQADDMQAKRAQVAANLVETKAMLKNIETNYNRMQDLFSRGSATQKEFDDITAAYESAKAKVTAVQEADKELADVMSYASLASPVSGFIAEKFVQQGDMAAPAMPLLVVEGGGVSKAAARVPESDIALFRKGDKVDVQIDAIGKSVKGTVEQISQSGSGGSREFDVTVRLEKITNADLKSSMFAKVLLKKGVEKGVTIPESVLVNRGDLEGVFVMSSAGESLLRWVRTGKRSNGNVEILSGLSAGETVIVSAEGKLQDGKKAEACK